MTRKEKGDYLIELTAWAGLTVSLMLQIKTLNIIGVILLKDHFFLVPKVTS
jgi:hypothetical protein